ncbi:MAG: hypothetical protein MUC59_05985 [Saprospiraceae bacterium]|jgi:hypothetical protein|nr:hypothetical protein [Saprospiraceae bacterium]
MNKKRLTKRGKTERRMRWALSLLVLLAGMFFLLGSAFIPAIGSYY